MGEKAYIKKLYEALRESTKKLKDAAEKKDECKVLKAYDELEKAAYERKEISWMTTTFNLQYSYL